MATEEEANAARRQHGKLLRKLGVHSIGVEQRQGPGKPGWVVVAEVAPKQPVKLPESLSAGSVSVPVVLSRSEPPVPE